MTNQATFNYGIFAALPAVPFTIVELLAHNNIEKTRINQIKCQRKLNALVAKGEISKEKVGLENKFSKLTEDTAVKGSAIVATPADELNFELPVVEYGFPSTINVGTTPDGFLVQITKTRKYASNKTCVYGTNAGAGYRRVTTAAKAIELAKEAFRGYGYAI